MGLLLALTALGSVVELTYGGDDGAASEVQANAPVRLDTDMEEPVEVPIAKTAAANAPIEEQPHASRPISREPVEGGAPLVRSTIGGTKRVERSTAASSPADGPGMLQMMWPLCIVLAVVGGVAYGVRRWMPKSLRTSAGGTLQVIARQPISAKQSICLVRVGRRLVLMGVTPDHISTLSEITDPEESAAIVAAVESSRPTSFATTFGRMTDQELQTAESEEANDDASKAFADDAPLATKQLAQTRVRVKGLLDRVRSLAGEMTSASAETAQRAAAPR